MTVEELLSSKKITFQPKGKDFLVSCLNPDHADRNPSMRVDQITGVYNCFSCGFKGNVFTLYGEKVSQLQIRRELLRRKIIEKRAETVGLPFPSNSVPYIGNWRQIKPETYKHFEAFQNGSSDHVGRIVFPIRDISGKIVAFNGRHTTGGNPKYKISPPGAKLPLFPAVSARNGKIMLVEGIYDMINLYDKGIKNVACCFGTKNISEDKLSLLKMQGATQVDIFFDGDDAGQNAAETIKAMCEKVGLFSRNVFLKNTDPGALSESQVKKLETKLYG